MNILFVKAFDRVIGHEGRFQKQPGDRGNWTGGAVRKGILKGTKFGISAMTYPDLDIERLTLEQAKAIYYRDWWLKLEMDLFKPALSYQMFDAAINHGMHNATKMLQRAVGADDDGVIGPITKRTIDKMPLEDILMRFLGERLEFMTYVGTWDDNGKGWSRRIALNLKLAAEDTP
jgi:lysozyme family protein